MATSSFKEYYSRLREYLSYILVLYVLTQGDPSFNRFWVRKLAQNWNLMESPDFLLQQLTFPSPCQFSVFFRVTQVKEHPGIPQAISRHYRSFWSSHSVDPLVLLSLIIIISTLPLLVNCHNLAAAIWNVISIVTKERNIMHHVLLSALAHRGKPPPSFQKKHPFTCGFPINLLNWWREFFEPF